MAKNLIRKINSVNQGRSFTSLQMFHTHTSLASLSHHMIYIFSLHFPSNARHTSIIFLTMRTYNVYRIQYTVVNADMPCMQFLHYIPCIPLRPCIPFIPRWPTLTCFLEHRYAILYFPTSTSICTIRKPTIWYTICIAMHWISFHSQGSNLWQVPASHVHTSIVTDRKRCIP